MSLEIRPLGLDGVLEVTPTRFGDHRGFFTEAWNAERFESHGIAENWCQENHSFSADPFTLRGLHFQTPPFAQSKLVRVITGEVFDVAVDIRVGSPTFGDWVGVTLSAAVGNQILVPKGFAHGFVTLTPDVHMIYKVDAAYAPDHDRSIAWNDESIGISWPLEGAEPKLSEKDRAAKRLGDVDTGFVFGA
ncbi:MAG: dTDP-4-dehydrorhamnose 3,5-epimerase [Pseudomonadota bacterium]